MLDEALREAGRRLDMQVRCFASASDAVAGMDSIALEFLKRLLSKAKGFAQTTNARRITTASNPSVMRSVKRMPVRVTVQNPGILPCTPRQQIWENCPIESSTRLFTGPIEPYCFSPARVSSSTQARMSTPPASCPALSVSPSNSAPAMHAAMGLMLMERDVVSESTLRMAMP